MEELSIEERATRYNAALEYAHCLIEQCKEGTEGSFHRADLDKMFPELRESDDERIRKEILEYFQQFDNKELRGVDISDWIAWLEQGEQKPWSEEDDRILYNVKAYIGYAAGQRGVKDELFKEANEWLNSLPIGFIYNKNYNEDMVTLLIGELKQIANNNNAPEQYQAEINWLKSLRPQNKIYYWTENEIKFAISDYIRGVESYEKMVEKLRCLKPQSQWKPSDAQMASITCAVRKMKESACYDSELVHLLQDLKKLKG